MSTWKEKVEIVEEAVVMMQGMVDTVGEMRAVIPLEMEGESALRG